MALLPRQGRVRADSLWVFVPARRRRVLPADPLVTDTVLEPVVRKASGRIRRVHLDA